MGLAETIMNLDRRIIFWIAVIIICIPAIQPFGLPVPVTPDTITYYEYIDALQAGDVVVISQEADPSILPEVQASLEAACKLIAAKDVKIIIFTVQSASCVPIVESIIFPILEDAGYVYGDDFCFFGYIPQGAEALTRLSTGFRETVVTDYFGTPLDDVPVMADIDWAGDIDLYFTYGAYYMDTSSDFIVKYRVPALAASAGWAAAGMKAAVAAGTLKSYLTSLRGAAEFEVHSGLIGKGLARVESLTFVHIYLLILMLLTNIVYFAKRTGGG